MLTQAEKDLWVETLRSGKFPDGSECKQTKEVLRNENGFCCLGVACELFIPETAEQSVKKDFYYYGKNQEHAVLPKDLMLKIGISNNGDFEQSYALNKLSVPAVEAIMTDEQRLEINVECYAGLAALNDRGLSFEQIAELLDTYLETED